MLNEEPNHEYHWKSKLEDLESLPNETFNKEAAWDTLHGRMQKKPRTKIAVWYWAAAACLLLAVLIPWLFLANKNGSTAGKNTAVHKEVPALKSRLLPVLNKDTSFAVARHVEKKGTAAPGIKQPTRILPKHQEVDMPEVVSIHKENKEFVTPAITNSTPISTAINITSILPAQKKLKVVHVNELGDPLPDAPNIAKTYDRRSLQVKLINQDAYTTSLPQGSTGFNFFKSKNAPSN